MYKAEYKKVLFNSKGILLIIALLVQVIFSNMMSSPVSYYTENQMVVNQEYYNQLHGKLDDQKRALFNEEGQHVQNAQANIIQLQEQYFSNNLSDEEYIQSITIEETYLEKSDVYTKTNNYLNYVSEDVNRQFINNDNMIQYLNRDIPYLFIIVIIILCAMSLHFETETLSLLQTTVVGKQKLMRVKMHVLISISITTLFVVYIINLITLFDMHYFHELFATMSSTTFFNNSTYSMSIIGCMAVQFVMQCIACIILISTAFLVYIRFKIDTIKLLFMFISIYILPLLLTTQKFLYWILPIGFFNPIYYFVSGSDVTPPVHFLPLETYIVLLVASVVAVIMYIFVPSKKMYKAAIGILCMFILTGCNQIQYTNVDSAINYKNDTFHYNDDYIILSNHFYGKSNNKMYHINRDVLKNILSIENKYIFHNLLYYTYTEDGYQNIVELNLDTFEQQIIYSKNYSLIDPVTKVFTPNIMNSITQIYKTSTNLYVCYPNRVEMINNDGSSKEVLDVGAYFITTIDSKIYYKDTTNQLYTYDTKTNEKSKVFDYLVNTVYIENDTIYFSSFRDGLVYSFDTITKEEKLLVEKSVNGFDVYDGFLYYVSLDSNGMYKQNLTTHEIESMLLDYKIYDISLSDSGIVFVANNSRLENSEFYYDYHQVIDLALLIES